jgi:hypothetical protein
MRRQLTGYRRMHEVDRKRNEAALRNAIGERRRQANLSRCGLDRDLPG